MKGLLPACMPSFPELSLLGVAKFMQNRVSLYKQYSHRTASLQLLNQRTCAQDAVFVLNVVVHQRHRRQGVGRALMGVARQLAAERWGSRRMCAQVSAQNEVI